MSFGSPTPIEVAVQGASLADDYAYAQKVQSANGASSDFLRDLQFAQDYELPDAGHQHRSRTRRPIRPDHGGRGAFRGARHVLLALHRSRTTGAIPNSGNAFQIQVEMPQNRMQSVESIGNFP